jgi:nucleotide-binding universal stress UspA family protein
MPDPLGGVKSLLVPIDGSDAAYSALAAACDIARHHKATVATIHVIEVPRSLPLDAELGEEAERGEIILLRAEAIAKEHDIKVRADLVQARQAGHAVVDEAMDSKADAIVVGLDYHRPYGRFQMGRLPLYVLENAPCEVWLFRYAPREGEDHGHHPPDAVTGARRE